jgi:hypothetical protein
MSADSATGQAAIVAALAFAADPSDRAAAGADALRTERHPAMLQDLASMGTPCRTAKPGSPGRGPGLLRRSSTLGDCESAG